MGGSAAGGGWPVVIGIGGGAVAVAGLIGFAASHRKAHRPEPRPPARIEVAAPAPVPDLLPGLARADDPAPDRELAVQEAGSIAAEPTATTDEPVRNGIDEGARSFDPFAGFHLPTATVRSGMEPPFDGLNGTFVYRSATFDPAAGIDLTDAEGVRIRIAPDAVVDGLGSPVPAPVTLSWTFVHDKAQLAQMPVPLETMVNGERTMLQSFGMVDLSLVGAAGGVELATPAEVSWPLAGRTGHFESGETAPLYEMNEITDRWDLRGSGHVDGERFVAMIPNRGTWNCDAPVANTGCVRGRLRAQEPFELPDDALVSVTGVEPNLWQTTVQPSPSGDFCANAFPLDPSEIKAFTGQGSRCFRTVRQGRVQASAPGTHCRVNADACAVVDVVVEETPCAGPFVSLADKRGFGTLEIAVPDSVKHVIVDCPPLFRDLVQPQDGRVAVERVPASAKCHVDLDLGDRVYRMETINGAQSWTCTDDGRFSCQGPPKRTVDLARLSRTEPVLIHGLETVAASTPSSR